MENKKQINETTIMEEIRRGRVSLPPVSLELEESGSIRRIDATIIGRWNRQKIIFNAEIKALSTPKIFNAAIVMLKHVTQLRPFPPLLICPFLSETQLQQLEREGINGVDLCGNGVINIPGTLTVFRTGQKNRFPSNAPIKNVYRKNSSMVGRMFFACSRFSSVTQVADEIGKRDVFSRATGQTPLSFGTVSKALSAMVQDLIIERGDTEIALLQPDKLLGKLSREYTGLSGIATVSVKVDLDRDALIKRLADISVQLKTPIVATGLSSVSRYAVMQREDKLSIFCPLTEELLDALAPTTSSRFPNLEILGTNDATAFFDAREEGGFFWASPLQTYLELMSGDKRDQETAEQVKQFLLNAIKEAKT